MQRIVQSLNDAGVTLFQEWLENPVDLPPKFLLDDARYCDAIAHEYMVDTSRKFTTTFELGKYLHEDVFASVNDLVAHRAATGMWAWLSLAMLENILGRTSAKLGKPLDVPHYISAGRRLGYRLIARTAWELVRTHGHHASVALGSTKSPWGEMAEQLTSRQEVFAHPSFWAVARRLYLNQDGELRRGATSQRPAKAKRDPTNAAGRGGARRLPLTFRQFDRTYNTRGMSLDEMLLLLPNEYRKWINNP